MSKSESKSKRRNEIRSYLALALMASLAGLISITAHATTSSPEIVMTSHQINPKRNAASLGKQQEIALRNSICGSLLKAGALSVGVPAGAVDVAKLLAYTARSGGEDSPLGRSPRTVSVVAPAVTRRCRRHKLDDNLRQGRVLPTPPLVAPGNI